MYFFIDIKDKIIIDRGTIPYLSKTYGIPIPELQFSLNFKEELSERYLVMASNEAMYYYILNKGEQTT